MSLTREELNRYKRHLVLPEVGLAGQEALRAGRVLVVGAGGLGSPVAMYLAAAGVGTIGLVDADRVDLTNLQRQILHGEDDIGRPKTESARDTLRQINPHLALEEHPVFLDESNAMDLVSGYDVVVDGTDNFTTRYLVNDACVFAGRPTAYGSVFRFEGQATVFDARHGPCYRCLYPDPPPPGAIPNCAEGGVFGVLPGLIGTIQATEAIKLLLGAGDSLLGRLLLFDALGLTFRTMRLRKDPACPICGEAPRITDLRAEDVSCNLPGNDPPMNEDDLQPADLRAALDGPNPPTVLDVREDYERETAAIEPSLHIPLGDLPARAGELDPAADLVVYCKMGGRSAQAVELLRGEGFGHLRNLAGGILAWRDQIDPGLDVI